MWAAARTHHYDLNMIMWRYVDAKTPEEESPFVQNKSEFVKEDFTMKKIGLGIAILLFAIMISLCSSGMGLLVIGIGIVGLIFSIIGFMERK